MIAALARGLRVHHWAKNLLVFVPLLTAHEWSNAAAFRSALLAWAAFSLCASGMYLLNDLLDAEDDRRHPRKRGRPVASGALPRALAGAGAIALPLAGLGLALALPPAFLWCLAGYVLAAGAYSAYLKRRAIADVLTLAGLHTLRVIAGAAAIGVPLSFWLLAFSVFLFLALALAKRCTELRVRGDAVESGWARGYLPGDLGYLRIMGVASGYAAVVVFALFIHSAEVAESYRTPEMLWLSCPALLYWISRIWLKEARGALPDDPLVYALRDPASHAVLAAMIAALWLAL